MYWDLLLYIKIQISNIAKKNFLKGFILENDVNTIYFMQYIIVGTMSFSLRFYGNQRQCKFLQLYIFEN
jgi:hypothetical protein